MRLQEASSLDLKGVRKLQDLAAVKEYLCNMLSGGGRSSMTLLSRRRLAGS